MSNLITVDEFKILAPNANDPQKWVDAMHSVLPSYEITRGNRLAMFIAQCGHESGGFTILQENLNYSAQGLRKIFSKYFPTDELAAQYARQPEKIANRVYANRMRNGNEASGDGWKFRGRGIIQLTGRDNYERLSEFIWEDPSVLSDNPDLLADHYISLHGAGWYWERTGLNAFSDRDDILTVTKRINGGTHGLADRTSRYELAKKVLS